VFAYLQFAIWRATRQFASIWNDKMTPPWDSKYTININAQMNYWPAEKANLSEMREPFLKMVKDMRETGYQTNNPE
jgi:alpha-L-fucosidase 2